VYISDADQGLSLEALDVLVRKASAFNVLAGVTGVLLYDGVRFLQFIEGPEDGMHAVYGRIASSIRHTRIMELGRAEVDGRHFPYWGMRLLPAKAEQLKAAMLHDWSSFALGATTGGAEQPGLEHLRQIVAPHIVSSGQS